MDELRHDARRPAAVERGVPHPEREYLRAMRDFTQLTRRRLANPVTALTAGISALRELEDDLDPEVRDELLVQLQQTASKLEIAVLHPELARELLFSQICAAPEQTIDFLCECWALECDQHVSLPIADYFIVHAGHDQFVIAPNHDLPAVEHVVERRDGWRGGERRLRRCAPRSTSGSVAANSGPTAARVDALGAFPTRPIA